ncbi:coiled-coil domain-containing protein 13-like isoform X1 [Arapaima gigas]
MEILSSGCSLVASTGPEESDDEKIMENLKMQFQTLQIRQGKSVKKGLGKRGEQKEKEKPEEKQENGSAKGRPVSGQEGPKPSDSHVDSAIEPTRRLSQESSEQLQDQVRQLQDENGRLRKLVNEKNFEINRMKKTIEEEQLALSGHRSSTCKHFQKYKP